MLRGTGRIWRIGLVALAGAVLGASWSAAFAQQTPGARPNTTEIRKSRPVEAAPAPPPAASPAAAAPLRPSIPADADRADDDAAKPPDTVSNATGIEIAADRRRTTLTVALTQPVPVAAFALADPYRVIVDAADLGFQLPAGLSPRGLVTGVRYGLLSPGQSRIVLDVSGPVRIVKAEVVPSLTGAGAQMIITLEPTDRPTFLAAIQAREAPPAAAAATEKAPQSASGKPVVIIDPGHGGLDPGALGQNGIREKDLTLAVARQVRSMLSARGLVDVRMTRRGDDFLSLDQRVAFSQQAGASLFVSIHADSVGDVGIAQAVRGASVYTLSSEASSKQAKVLAEKENAADLRAGLTAAAGAGGDQIKSILYDLMNRETQNFSSEIRSLLVSNLKRTVALAKEPARSAAFKVLQQAHAPSVLVELGYLSHTEDAALLQSPEWQKQVAGSIVAAIEQFFARHAGKP